MIKYAKIVYNGEEVTADKEEGIKYFKNAADNGDNESLYIYGKILFDGVYIT